MTDTQMFDAMEALCAAGVIYGFCSVFKWLSWKKAALRNHRWFLEEWTSNGELRDRLMDAEFKLRSIQRQRSDIVARGNRTRKAKRAADKDAMTAALRAGAGL